MKTRMLFVLLAGSLVALAACLVHEPSPAQAEDVPEKYRDTVNKGLEYLAKHQHRDGHWEGDGGKHPVAMTGLAGLALFMEASKNPNAIRTASSERIWKYSANIRRAVDWLMENSQAGRGGLIYSGHDSETARYMEGHGLAMLFLVGALQAETDRARRQKLTEVLTRAVKYTVKAQSSQGGWYHTSKMEGHDFDVVLATGIQVQALQAADNEGIAVPDAIIHDGQEYLKMAVAKYDKAAKPGEKSNRRTDTATALGCQHFNRRSKKMGDLCDKWLKYCRAEIPVGRAMKLGHDEWTHYYYAQVRFNQVQSGLGEFSWDVYRTATFDHLKSSQNKDGNWPAGDGVGVGPVYSTAVWCIVLQLDKNNHPSVPTSVGIVLPSTRGPELWPRLRFARMTVGVRDA